PRDQAATHAPLGVKAGKNRRHLRLLLRFCRGKVKFERTEGFIACCLYERCRTETSKFQHPTSSETSSLNLQAGHSCAQCIAHGTLNPCDDHPFKCADWILEF